MSNMQDPIADGNDEAWDATRPCHKASTASQELKASLSSVIFRSIPAAATVESIAWRIYA
jgi:hypothetical protein